MTVNLEKHYRGKAYTLYCKTSTAQYLPGFGKSQCLPAYTGYG